jgi:hypothetical protein
MLLYFKLFCARKKRLNNSTNLIKKEADLSLNIPGFMANFFINNKDDHELEALLDKSSIYKVLIYDDNSDNVLKNLLNRMSLKPL